MFTQYGFQFKAMDGVTAVVSKIQASVGAAERAAVKSNASLSRMTGGMSGMLSGMQSMIIGAGAAYAAFDTFKTTMNYESMSNALRSVSGSAQAAEANLKFVNDTVDAMGLKLDTAMSGFTMLRASMSGATDGVVQDIFRGVSTGVTVLGLGAEKAERVFTALGQIASKGSVQSEELKGQIGEALPGAFAHAAKAMGVTEMQLNKLLDKGGVMAKEFLPQFAKALEEVYGKDLARAINSAQANFNRFNTELFRSKVAFGELAMPAVIAGLRKMTDWFRAFVGFVKEHKESITTFFNRVQVVVGTAIDVIGRFWADNKKTILGVAEALLYVGGAVLGTMAVMRTYGAIVATIRAVTLAYGIAAQMVTLFTSGWTVAQWAINTALAANPVGIVVGAVLALAAGVLYAWNHFEGFRGFLVGFWEMAKHFGDVLYDFMIAPLVALGKTLIGVFTFDPTMIAAGIQDGMAAAQRVLDAPRKLSAAFATGYNSGANMAPIDPVSAITGVIDGMIPKSVYGKPEEAGAGGDQGGKGGGVTTSDVTGDKSGISGGDKIKTINIRIDKLIEAGGMVIHTTNITESASQIRARVTEALMSAVNDVNYAD
jgi:tape measure domain-containing protein